MEHPIPQAYRAPTLAQHLAAGGPKRVLALDGGGVRGILTLGFLERIEGLLRQRHGGDPAFRLCDYFDLIAGTSTGSIIAALLAQGRSVAEVIALYQQLADQVFTRDLWRRGVLRVRYDRAALAGYLQANLGPTCRMGDGERLRTGLLIVTKRFDTGKPWPIGNNPGARYFSAPPGSTLIANRDYPLWQVVRASTAAPTFFEPEEIAISNPATGQDPEEGAFVDGGVSPYNNPALQAYLYATLAGYNLRWQPDPEKLLIISVGTGRPDPSPRPRGRLAQLLGRLSAVQGITALTGLMNDCSVLVEALMQGMGTCLTPPRRIDADMQTLCDHQLVDAPRFRYARYDVKLFPDRTPPRDGIDDTPILQQLQLNREALLPLQQMDNPRPLKLLLALGRAAAAEKVREEHFPSNFDLPRPVPVGGDQERRAYRRRQARPVVAVQLNLETEGFRYQKWGGQQVCKRGDWLVNSNGSMHTVDRESFARTYRPVGPGLYEKHTTIWAQPAAAAGAVSTLEGATHYEAGDYLVWNDPEGSDTYAIPRARFEELYEPLPEE